MSAPLSDNGSPTTTRAAPVSSTSARTRCSPLRVSGRRTGSSGADTDQTRAARAFADRLDAIVDVPVELYYERFTTRIAARGGGAASEDSRAAAVLLDDWLARHG